MRDRFGAKDPRSWMLRFHAQTAGCTLTAQQPDNNVVRVTIQALAAVFGGTQSLHTNSRDEALSLPSEDSVRIALRTQQLIAHESGVADTVDPLGGSWCIEALTSSLEKQAADYIRRIDRMGGAVAALEAGYVQNEIQDASYRHQMEVERKERIVVGVNDFTSEGKPLKGLLKVNPRVGKEQRGRLAALRKRRDAAAVRASLDELVSACRGRANVMGPILDAVRRYATLGEISDAMRSVFGVHRGRETV
jgi:methylmalonyl-CoA mutase N-terminal domain/subunit